MIVVAAGLHGQIATRGLGTWVGCAADRPTGVMQLNPPEIIGRMDGWHKLILLEGARL